jgi:ubiquinone biosynthesis protein COQ9
MERADLLDRLLDAALPHVPFDGWSATLLARAAHDAGISANDLLLACPRGALDLIEHWVARADRAMVEAAAAAPLATMKVREKIAFLVRLRLEPLTPHREAVRRALALQAASPRAPKGLEQLYRTVDTLWRAAGDTSTDWNFYSKRLLLAGVYSATLLYWLNDRSEGSAATWAFLDRRIADVMRIEKAKGRIHGLADRLPDPFDLLRRVAQRG